MTSAHLTSAADARNRNANAPHTARAAAGGFCLVTAAGHTHLADVARYLTAIRRRLERLPHTIQAGRERMPFVHGTEDAYNELVQSLPPARKTATDVREIAWQIEELRVSLRTQQLRTPRPVSV